MAGLPQSVTVEIEFIPSTWTDVTAYVAAEARIGGRFGRATEFEDVGPATFGITLRNDDGRFTPDSGGSPYFPNVIEGRRLRVTLTQDGVARRLFTGSILAWEPDYSAGALKLSTVSVSASDSLATLALHTLDSRWVEETRALARAATTWADVYVLAGDATTAAWDNIGASVGADYGTATIVKSASGVGEVAYGSPTSLTLERSAEFRPSAQIGSAVLVDPAGAPATISFWLQVPSGTLPGTDAMPLPDGVVLSVRAGGELLSLRLVDDGSGTCALSVYVGGFPATLTTGIADAGWRLVTLAASGSSTVITVTTQAGATVTTTVACDLTTTTALWVGAEAVDGSAGRCAPMSIAGLTVAGAASVTPDYRRGLAGQTYTHPQLYAAFQSYLPEVTDWATSGNEIRVVGEPTWAGRTALDVLQTIARTINGVAYVNGSGSVVLAAADVVRPAVSAASLDIEGDLDVRAAVPTLRRASDSRPTRVTISYAGGTTTLVDTAAEANRQPRREIKVDTCAGDIAGAVFAGSYVLQSTNGLRITQVAVDLTTTQADLWAVFLALYPTQRVTIAGFDPALIGASTMVVYVQGWKLDVDQGSVVFVLDCSPASQFPSASWDIGDEYGRWAGGTTLTVTGGTAIGTAVNGTLAISWGVGSVGLSQDVGDYPIYLDWLGERVRIDVPPAGATSPQTVTTAERGAFPTAARSNHVPGEAVDVYHAALWGF